VGCLFARLIARRPQDYTQTIQIVSGAGTPKRVSGNIARRFTRLVADKNVTAGALLLPEVKTLQSLTEITLQLSAQPGWTVSTSTLTNYPAQELVAVHIVRAIPFGTTECPSEALVLGPFDEFPKTRRSPVTAIEMYVGEPLTHDPKTGVPTTKANLAHISLPVDTQPMRDKLWKGSILGRLKSLGGEDSRAKAKVSFVIPKKMATDLGCAP